MTSVQIGRVLITPLRIMEEPCSNNGNREKDKKDGPHHPYWLLHYVVSLRNFVDYLIALSILKVNLPLSEAFQRQ